MAFCLPPAIADKFFGAIRDGTLDPNALSDLSSADRRAELAKYVGEENAADVNAALESKMLLKDQQAGFVTWAKQTSGLTEPARRDLISRIEKLDRVLNPTEEKAFLADLAAQKIGATVSMEEAKTISEGAKTIQDLRAKISEDAPIGSDERLAYGFALDGYHKYMNGLLGRGAETLTDVLRDPKKWLGTVASTTKGILSSMDNSFFGRQGLKMLYTSPSKWAVAFAKSWGDIAKELRGIDAMDVIRADILSRPNALSGKYKAMGADLAVDFEEAFPSHLPENIPVLGRLYKASEAAFNGGALRLRSDYSDRIIAMAEKNGLDMTNPAQAQPLGLLVNSMTGRGKIALAGQELPPAWQQAINASIFSLKFLKSNYDTLTAHSLGLFIKDPMARRFMQKQAAMNLAKISGGVSAILMTAKMIDPNSTDLDPRSSSFGKIKFGHTTIDVTAGMGAIVTLVARMVTNTTKNQAGQIKEMGTGQFGSKTRMDVINDFWEGRLSPIAGAIRDWLKGENFQGQKPTSANTAANLVTPLPFQTMMQARNEPSVGAAIAATVADFLGFNANPPNATGLDLPARDPTEIELVRLGFTPNNFKIATGDSHADELVDEKFQPLAARNITGLVNSPGYARMTDAYRALVLRNVIDGSKRMATGLAAAENQKLFMRLKLEGKFNQQQRDVLQEQTGQTPEDMLAP